MLSISCERWISTVSRSIASSSAAVQKSPLVSAWLRVRYSAARILVLLAGRRELELDGDVARFDLAAVQVQARLEDLDALQGMAGLRLPELGDRLGVDALDVAGLRADLGPLDLPVVLGRGGDAVAVVAQADLVLADQLLEGFLDGGQERVGVDGRVECRGDVLGGAVDALDELERQTALQTAGASGWSTVPAMPAIFARISPSMLVSTRS